jgi:hypothetical protein
MNFGEGIGSLTGLDMANADVVGKGLISLSAGMAAFFAANALGRVDGFFGSVGKAFKDGWNWIWGNESEGTSSGPIANMLAALEPLKTLDEAIIAKMEKFGVAINGFVSSFKSLNEIKTEQGSQALSKMMVDIGGVLSMMDALMKGGEYDTKKGGFLSSRRYINFGPGLDSLDEGTLQRLSSGVDNLRGALGRSQATDQAAVDSASREAAAVAAQVNVGPTTVINQGGSQRTTLVTANPKVSAQMSFAGGF